MWNHATVNFVFLKTEMGKNKSILKFSRKVTAVLLSLMLLLSGTGFSFNAHYCGNELKAWSVFGETTECDMPSYVEKACPSHEGMIIKTPVNCCNDNQIRIDRVDHEANMLKAGIQTSPSFVIFNQPISFEQPVFAASEYKSFNLKRPPPTDRNIYIRVQSFLL